MADFRDHIEALGFHLFLSVSKALGVERASALGNRMLRLVGPQLPRHSKVLRNLEIAFPEKDGAWYQQTAVAMWGDFGRSLAEYPHLPDLCSKAGDPRIDFVDHANTETLRREGRPIMFVAAHQANWNLPAVVGHRIGLPLSVLYRRRKNPRLEALIEHWRNQMTCGFIDVDERASKAMLDELRRGHCVGLFIDRRARDGELIPFFGKETPTPTIAARLALKTKAAFIAVRTERLSGVRFRITLYPPIEPDAHAANDRERARQMTEAANSLFESWIRERPEQWLSTAKRWPRDTPTELAEAA